MWSYDKPMPAMFLRQELFHQMFAVSDIVTFCQKYLTAVHQEKWFLGFLHNNVMSKIDVRSCYLYCWSTEWPCLRTDCSCIRNYAGRWAFTEEPLLKETRQTRKRRQMEHPKTAAQKWWWNISGSPEPFSREPHHFLFIHLSSSSFLSGSRDGPGTCSWWQEVENSYFASVFVLRNELIKEADLEMSQAVPCSSAEDELIGNEDD